MQALSDVTARQRSVDRRQTAEQTTGARRETLRHPVGARGVSGPRRGANQRGSDGQSDASMSVA
jgi:hypothetical protein